MKYVIDEDVVKKLGMDLPSLFATLLVKVGVDIPKLFEELEHKQVLVKGLLGYSVTQRWNDTVDNILLSSEKTIPKDEDLAPLAEKLMEIFPQGRKPDTPYYWKCNKREVILKLKSFYKLYGNSYTEEEILDAAYRYVDAYKDDRRTMRLLKYFIWKKDRATGEEISELASFIDNADQEDECSNWVNELV